MSSKLSCFSFRTSLLTMRCLSQSNLRRAGCAGPNPGRPSPVPLAKPFYSRMHAPSTSNNTVGSITRICSAAAAEAAPAGASRPVKPEQDVKGMTQFLDSLKFDKNGLVAVIVQNIDTGEVCMQAYADRAALNETLQTGLATFYSRSRKGRWCKGETSGHFIHVHKVFADCDKDSIIYLSDPIGPSCHTGARTCWFSEVDLKSEEAGVCQAGDHKHADHVPLTTLLALEATIEERKAALSQPQEPGTKPSWTARLLSNPELLCKKIREEAGELCQTLEANEGSERAASEMADLLYHSMVLLNLQGVKTEEVMRVLRKRFGTSGIEEKAARPPKAPSS